MAKPITLADVKHALTPLEETINRLRQENTTVSAQVSEIHSMMTALSQVLDGLSGKIDHVNTNVDHTLAQVTTNPVKKPASRKATSVKKVEIEADEEDAEVESDEESTKTEPEKSTKAEEKPTKAEVEKSTKVEKNKAEAKPVKKPQNKLNLFNAEYKANPEKFAKYLTKDVQKRIHEAYKDNWKDLSEQKLTVEKRTAYYNYMKEHHDDVLVKLKEAVKSESDEE